MIGARDVAFPRLNALSYWLFAFGGLVLMLSFFAQGGAATSGWTAYPPLSTEADGNGQDAWILSLHILTASSVAGAINFIVTIQNMRTRGMTWTRMPLFVWSIYIFAWLLMAVLPTLSAGLTLLLLDRGLSIGPWDVETSFFDPADGGAPVHLPARRSGSSGTPRSTSWRCPRSDRVEVLPVAPQTDLRLRRRSRSRRSRSASSRCSSGHTMFHGRPPAR